MPVTMPIVRGGIAPTSAQYERQPDTSTLHSTTPDSAAGRLDPSAWEGLEDTDPAIDVSKFDVAGVGPRGFAMVCDDGVHPDRPIGGPTGLGYDLAPDGREMAMLDPRELVP